MLIKIFCCQCNKEAYKTQRQIKRYKTHFCSQRCSGLFHKRTEYPKVKCKEEDCNELTFCKSVCKIHYYRNWGRKEKVKAYRSTHQKLSSSRYRVLLNRAKSKNQIVELTEQDHSIITLLHCTYCNRFSIGENYCGIDRIDSKLGYTKENSIPCCSMCNYMKTDFNQDEWLENIARIYKFLNLSEKIKTINQGLENEIDRED